MSGYSGWAVLGAAVAGLLVTLLLIRTIAVVAPRVGLVDIPDARKQHEGHVPLVGGIALVSAYLVAAAAFLPALDQFAGFAACIGILLVVGVLDDIGELRPSARLVAQAGAAGLLVTLGEMQITSFGNLLGTGEIVLHPAAGFLFTVFCVVSLINGLNMLDGLDGLAGGIGAVMLGAFLLIAMVAGMDAIFAHASVLLACLAGFLLFHNLRTPLRRRLVFLGDAGSMVLGFALAWAAIALGERPGASMYPIAAVWVLGLVVLDTIATVVRRLMQRRSPLSAGRDHLHHLLLELGFAPQKVVMMLLAASAVLSAIGIAGWLFELPEATLTYGFVGLSAVYFIALNIGWRIVVRREREQVTHLAPIPFALEPLQAMEDAELLRKAG